ncbi:MAG: glycogen-binding domain-containing protein [Gemmatimonadota bacterium]
MATGRPTNEAPRTSHRARSGALLRILVVGGLASVGPLASPGAAQESTLSIDAGQATFDLGQRDIETSHLVLGIMHARPDLWFGASVSPALTADDPFWGGVWIAASPGVTRDRWRPRLDLGGQVFGQDDPFGQASGVGVGAEALPRLGYAVVPEVELGVAGGGQVYHSGFGEGTEFTRTVGVVEGFAAVTPRGTPSRITGSARHLFAEEGGYTLLELSAYAAGDRIAGWASAGTWLGDVAAGVDDTPWEVGAAVRFADRAWVRAGVRREAFDPLYLNDARTSWSIGTSITLGGHKPGSTELAGVEPPVVAASGTPEVRLRADGAYDEVSIAGDFTNWEARAMTLEGEYWVYRAPLPEGVYSYAFVDGDGGWFVPEGTPGRREDGMGGWVAVLIVN